MKYINSRFLTVPSGCDMAKKENAIQAGRRRAEDTLFGGVNIMNVKYFMLCRQARIFSVLAT